MRGRQPPAERIPGMLRRVPNERSGAGIVVAPDKENAFEPHNQLTSLDNRKPTVGDYDEPNAEGSPVISSMMSPAERMASRLLEARRRGIQGLVLVSSRDEDEDDMVPSSGLPPIRKAIEDDHQKLDRTIGGDVKPIRFDYDAASKALSAADEELRRFFHPQMAARDSPPSSPFETSEIRFSTKNWRPLLAEMISSDSGSIQAGVIVPPSDIQRIPDPSNSKEEIGQELLELQRVAVPPHDHGGFLVEVFLPEAEEVEMLLNTESNNQIVALSEVNSIDESTGVMETAPSADTVTSLDGAGIEIVELPEFSIIDESTGVMETGPSADAVTSQDGTGIEIAELPEVNGSDETVVVINKTSSSCVKVSIDQSSTNGSMSDEEEDEDLEDQDTWSAATPRNDTNCFVEVFSPLAEEVMHLIGANRQIPALPELDEIEEATVIITNIPSADGPIPLSGDQSRMHANEESVKVEVPSDAALATPANHDLQKTEETHLHTANKSGGLCCFASTVDILMDDELEALKDATDDIRSHVPAQAAPRSTDPPQVVEKEANSTSLACIDTSDEKCAEQMMEAGGQSPRSVSTLDGHVVISEKDEVEPTPAVREETLEPAIENEATNPKDVTTTLTGDALELKTADTAIDAQAQDIESLTSTEAATSALIEEPTPELASEGEAQTPNENTTTPTTEPLDMATAGTTNDDQLQDAEVDASTEAAASVLLEETMEKVIEHGGPNPRDITTISTGEATSTSAALEMVTAVTAIDEQAPAPAQDVTSAATAEAAAPSALGEETRLEGTIELGEANRNEVSTTLTSKTMGGTTAGSLISDQAQDVATDTAAVSEMFSEKAIDHAAPAPNDSTTTSVSMPLDIETAVSVIDDQTEDVDSDATASATAPSSLRGEVTIEAAVDSDESNPVSTSSKTLDISTAGSSIDQDVEFNTSTEAATSVLKEETNFEMATEQNELNSNNITFSSTSMAVEAASMDPVVGNLAQDAESDTSTEAATLALKDESEVEKAIDHGASAPKDIVTVSTSTTHEITTAASVIDDEAHDIESDTSTDIAASLSEDDTLKPAMEREGLNAENNTTPPTNKTPEVDAAAAAMRRSARRRLRNLRLNRSRLGVVEGKEEHGKGS